MKPWILALLVVATGIAGVFMLGCSSDEEPAPAFFRLILWSRDKEKKPVPIRDRATLTTGTTVGMIVDGTGTCEIYIVYRDAGGKVDVLYPVSGGSAREEQQRKLFEGPLDETTGTEKFFVIASREALPALAQKIAAFRAGNAKGGAVLAEVQELRGTYEDASVAPARPDPIGGAMRGEPPENAALRYDVGTVPRILTFTIDHR